MAVSRERRRGSSSCRLRTEDGCANGDTASPLSKLLYRQEPRSAQLGETGCGLRDTLESVKPWVTFAGGVLVVAVLYWAQAVLVPFALAILLTFILAPPVTWLQRWVGRVPAVLLVVSLVFAALGLAGWGLTRQMDRLVQDLPGYRVNIRAKIADVRLA